MKTNIARRLSLLLAALLLAVCAPAVRAEEGDERFAGKTAAQVAQAFIKENNLSKKNFALSFYDTVTGEEYNYNETKMMTAASTFKLPLNLYYYELQAAGKISGSAEIPDADATLDECHERSLVYSDNEVSIAMLYHLGNFRTYKQLMRKYFTMTDAEIDPAYYADNNYCTRMMMDCLKYLYARQDKFPEMLGYLKQAEPGAYFKHYVTGCEIAHKYGSFDGAENDVGIFYTDEPFLLAVYTKGIVGEEICAQAGKLFYEYNGYLLRQKQAALEKAAQAQYDAAKAQAEQTRQAAEKAKAASEARAEQEKRAAAQAAVSAAPETPAAAASAAENAPQTRTFPWPAVMLAAAVLGAALVVWGLIALAKDRKKAGVK